MKAETRKPGFRMLVLITTPKLAQKAGTMFKEGGVPSYYKFYGKGTATSEIMEILGLGSIEKCILISFMPKVFSDEMMRKMKTELRLYNPNSGIAFSAPVSGGSSLLIKRLNQLQEEYGTARLEERKMEIPEMNYAAILAVVNQGYSGEVMDAARSAGAAGGTVFHARQAANEDTLKFWGISIQPEREMILILARQEEKLAIMKAIGEKCGVHSEARGVVVSMPVDQVIGFE
ncbi:MAG: hypothetical protein Q4F41_08525 [Eubacteriales bacterium]|nr:hypothetical protein [Eubacteriales bacterium]